MKTFKQTSSLPGLAGLGTLTLIILFGLSACMDDFAEPTQDVPDPGVVQDSELSEEKTTVDEKTWVTDNPDRQWGIEYNMETRCKGSEEDTYVLTVISYNGNDDILHLHNFAGSGAVAYALKSDGKLTIPQQTITTPTRRFRVHGNGSLTRNIIYLSYQMLFDGNDDEGITECAASGWRN